MFLHQHPFPPFIPGSATKLIVGTIPPPRFSTGELFDEDVDFCYGSKYGLLWPIMDSIFDLDLSFENTAEAIRERKFFLDKAGIGICDMVAHCLRDKMEASDLGMRDVKLRDLTGLLVNNERISTLLLMGGGSKNGPEYFLREHLKRQDIKLTRTSADRPKIHEFIIGGRKIKAVSLISPSSAANRAIGGDPDFKVRKTKNKDYTTLQFRIDQYRYFFN